MKIFQISLLLPVLLIAGCKSTKPVSTAPPTQEQALPPQAFSFGGRGEPSVDEQYVEACTYMIRGDYSSAGELFSSILEQNPDHHASHYNLARIELETRNFSSALEHSQSAIRLDANDWYRRLLIDIYERQGNLRRALEEQAQLHRDLPQDRSVWLHLAELQHRLGQTQQAIQTLAELHESVGKTPQSLMLQYQWAMDRKDYSTAVETSGELINLDATDGQWQNMRYLALVKTGDEEKTIEALLEWIEADPFNGQAQTLLADTYERSGNSQAAKEWLKKAMSNPNLDPAWKASYLQTKAESGQFSTDELTEWVNILKEVHPESSQAAAFQARLQVESQSPDSARSLLKIAADADPASLETWHQLLQLSFETGRYDHLYEDSRDAREMYPNNETILFFYGVGAASQGEYSKAIRALNKIVLIEPEDQEIFAGALAELARIETVTGDDTQASSHLEQALAISGEPFIKSREAWIMASQGQLNQAAVRQARAFRKAQDNPAGQALLGYVLWKNGDSEEAVSLLKEATDEAEVAEWLLTLGQLLLDTGDRDGARSAFERAREAGADINPEAMMEG